MTALTEILKNPEEHYPGNFDTPKRANALLISLCQDAAIEIERLGALKTTERELMQRALDAADKVLTGGDFDNPYASLKQAAQALRELLAQPSDSVEQPAQQESVRHTWDRGGERCVICGEKDWMGGACRGYSIKVQPAQQEPVGEVLNEQAHGITGEQKWTNRS